MYRNAGGDVGGFFDGQKSIWKKPKLSFPSFPPLILYRQPELPPTFLFHRSSETKCVLGARELEAFVKVCTQRATAFKVCGWCANSSRPHRLSPAHYNLQSIQFAHAHGDRSGLGHDGLRQSEPASSMSRKRPQLRHLNFAQIRHYNFALTCNMLIIYLMSNQLIRLLKSNRAVRTSGAIPGRHCCDARRRDTSKRLRCLSAPVRS